MHPISIFTFCCTRKFRVPPQADTSRRRSRYEQAAQRQQHLRAPQLQRAVFAARGNLAAIGRPVHGEHLRRSVPASNKARSRHHQTSSTQAAHEQHTSSTQPPLQPFNFTRLPRQHDRADPSPTCASSRPTPVPPCHPHAHSPRAIFAGNTCSNFWRQNLRLHTFTVLSLEADTSRRLSLDHATWYTAPTWPKQLPRNLPGGA